MRVSICWCANVKIILSSMALQPWRLTRTRKVFPSFLWIALGFSSTNPSVICQENTKVIQLGIGSFVSKGIQKTKKSCQKPRFSKAYNDPTMEKNQLIVILSDKGSVSSPSGCKFYCSLSENNTQNFSKTSFLPLITDNGKYRKNF